MRQLREKNKKSFSSVLADCVCFLVSQGLDLNKIREMEVEAFFTLIDYFHNQTKETERMLKEMKK